MEKRMPEEIDLYALLVSVVRFFKKNFLVFVVFIALATAASFMKYKRQSPSWQAKMIVMSDILPASYCDKIISNLNNFAHTGKHDEIARRFDIPKDYVPHLLDMTVESFKANKLSAVKDSVFIISVIVDDPAIIPRLESGIPGYFRNLDYVKTRTQLKRSENSAISRRISQEIKSLDSLKKNMLRGAGDPGLISTTIVALYEKGFLYENPPELSSGMQVVEGFSTIPNPLPVSLKTSILTGIIAGGILAFLFLGLLLIIRILKQS